MATEYRARSFSQGLRYKGNAGMWTWLLHRVTGLGILLFLIIHVADTALVVYRPDWYDHALDLYRSPLFRVAELGIFFAVMFHAFNGLRIIIQDFWPIAMLHQRRLAHVAIGMTAVLMLPVAWMMLAPLFGLADEPGTERARQRQLNGGVPVEASAAPAPVAPVSLEGAR
ncbi:succinate dehydrogenase, cytochrome b556 subunit [Longimicrobium terrae]|uniref:Succinate dehydrogenase cytochrome b556 subunit n=1 Tax=Longimicrobium terrae TaxID=1639882 RepID=A0A841GV43_9BACT|nr:succinate dehydrogenase, cytochrome b556 subunit [Longimicrobium terrae]MBB4634779.1 succinate dehydrogenase cytochrome b556 subunit [Longimicrobium terrae]MBB6069174.1 succinate dehydrogenase cytochrome b556 subunit [Longimicrobium terrae]NNC32010.1 succinate dehydrogenase, cytochrome b556 subunit [Longimicrobium terrae]